MIPDDAIPTRLSVDLAPIMMAALERRARILGQTKTAITRSALLEALREEMVLETEERRKCLKT